MFIIPGVSSRRHDGIDGGGGWLGKTLRSDHLPDIPEWPQPKITDIRP